MSLDPFLPYGPLVESTVRIVTWNVWGRYGDDSRQSLIEEALFNAQPDVVCLVESWSTTETDQPSRIAQRLGLDHALFVGEFVQDGWISGIGLVSRWPISNYDRMPLRTESEPLWTGDALYALIDGERGPIQLAIAMCA